MKRIASAILLVLFLFNIVGYYVLFFVLSSENRLEILNTSSYNKQLETLTFSASELKNIVFFEEGREFQYNGEMYDVKSCKKQGDVIVFECIKDKKEKELLTELNIHIKNNIDNTIPTNKKQNNNSKNIIQYFFLHQNQVTEEQSIEIIFPFTTVHFTSYISPTLPPPPPEQLFS